MSPWSPPGPPPASPNYFELPADVLEDPVELSVWVDRAVAVAERKKNKKNQK
jgi:TfoX/Sxy family transcriptional regulator of competence genes